MLRPAWETISVPPLETMVPLVKPPETTRSWPNSWIAAATAVPPDTSRVIPLLTTMPLSTTPEPISRVAPEAIE